MVRQRKLMEKQLREKPSPKKQICYNKKSFTISEEKKKNFLDFTIRRLLIEKIFQYCMHHNVWNHQLYGLHSRLTHS